MLFSWKMRRKKFKYDDNLRRRLTGRPMGATPGTRESRRTTWKRIWCRGRRRTFVSTSTTKVSFKTRWSESDTPSSSFLCQLDRPWPAQLPPAKISTCRPFRFFSIRRRLVLYLESIVVFDYSIRHLEPGPVTYWHHKLHETEELIEKSIKFCQTRT